MGRGQSPRGSGKYSPSGSLRGCRMASTRGMSRSTLWRNRDFVKLWAGQTVSLAGSQVTTLALPLTAVLLLRATPGQTGPLSAAQVPPFLRRAPFAGALG